LAVADSAPHPALLATHLAAALPTAATGHTFSWSLAILRNKSTRFPGGSAVFVTGSRKLGRVGLWPLGKASSIPGPGELLKGRGGTSAEIPPARPSIDIRDEVGGRSLLELGHDLLDVQGLEEDPVDPEPAGLVGFDVPTRDQGDLRPGHQLAGREDHF